MFRKSLQVLQTFWWEQCRLKELLLVYQSFPCANAVVNGGPQINVPEKLIQLKNPFYLDTNNSDHFWHPVGCSALKMIVSAQMREAVQCQGMFMNKQCWELWQKLFLFIFKLQGPGWMLPRDCFGFSMSFSTLTLQMCLSNRFSFASRTSKLIPVFIKHQIGVWNRVSTVCGR